MNSPRHKQNQRAGRKLKTVLIVAIGIITAAAATVLAVVSHDDRKSSLPPGEGSYLGVYATGAPESYAGVNAFTNATGVSPRLVVYYSGWLESFKVQFAADTVRHHAVPLIQMDPTAVSLKDIAAGRYDAYLDAYASAVKHFGSRVILSFGHEMNGSWYNWGYEHTSPGVFVAAWRHIVSLFREQAVRNVVWLWTVNIISPRDGIPNPAPWWPGSSYVNWIGLDGYYHKKSWMFRPLFGPTIRAVRELTLDPILISETGAPAADAQAAKIANLFAGIRAYGLLGFVWFDADKYRDWRISSPAAIAAYRRGARLS